MSEFLSIVQLIWNHGQDCGVSQQNIGKLDVKNKTQTFKTSKIKYIMLQVIYGLRLFMSLKLLLFITMDNCQLPKFHCLELIYKQEDYQNTIKPPFSHILK